MKKTGWLLIGLILIFQYSCNNTGTKAPATSSGKIKIENQGVNIEYDDSKTGDTSIVFIHGWGIDKTYWTNQVSFFSNRYRVITIDLPGFGKSGKNRNSWTVENYAKDVSTVLSALNLKNVILVGHSMSGAIAVETALTNPNLVISVVGVDNFKNVGSVETPQSKQETANIYKVLRTNYKETVTAYVNQALFSPSTDSVVRKRVLYEILNADAVVAVNILEQADSYAIDDKLKSLNKTLFLINSDFSPTDTMGLVKNNVSYLLMNIGPTGHYPMIEKPSDFNMLLQQAIDKAGQQSDIKK